MDYYFKKASERAIGFTITRVFVSFLILKDLAIYLLNSKILFEEDAIAPSYIYTKILKNYDLQFLKLPFHNHTFVIAFILISILLCLCFLAGIIKSITGVLLFFALMQIKLRNIYLQDGADNVIEAMLPFLALAYSYPIIKLGLNSNRFLTGISIKISKIKYQLALVASYAIVLQLCFIYFFTALSKIKEPIWQNGTAIYYIMRIEDFRASSLNVWLTKSSFFVYFATYFTLLWEVSFPFLIWFKKTKKWIILISIVMHLGILIFMRIDNFSFVMISFYPTLFNNEEWISLYNKIILLPIIKWLKFKTVHKNFA